MIHLLYIITITISCQYAIKLCQKLRLVLALFRIVWYNIGMNNGYVYESMRDENVFPVESFMTGGCSPHIHKSIEVLCVTKGDIRIFHNGSVRDISAGTVYFAESYDVHGYELLQPDAVGKVLIIPNSYLSNYRATKTDRMPSDNFLSEPNAYRTVRDLIFSFSHSKIKGELFSQGIATAVMGVIRAVVPYVECSATDKSDIMSSVLKYIYRNFTEDITLESLAKTFGYTPNHLSHLFNSYMPVTLKYFINTVRVENAAALIASGKNVLDAAMDSGFNSFRTFYRSFSKRYGCSPLQYVKV